MCGFAQVKMERMEVELSVPRLWQLALQRQRRLGRMPEACIIHVLWPRCGTLVIALQHGSIIRDADGRHERGRHDHCS